MKIWIETQHQGVYRTGGYAWLRAGPDGRVGVAGGLRDIDAAGLAVRALASALDGLPSGEALVLHLSDPDLIAGVRLLGAHRAAGWKDAEGEPLPDAQVWARVGTAAAGRALSLVRTTPADARSPAGFTAAWAELARDKAKARGAFQNAIPKPNLSKVPGLT